MMSIHRGKRGLRPNRAAIVYSDKLHSIFPDMPIVLGGIEARPSLLPTMITGLIPVRQSILADATCGYTCFWDGGETGCQYSETVL